MTQLICQRILLKLSGEALSGEKDCGIDAAVIQRIATDIQSVITHKVEVGIVVGGGNFVRGARLNDSRISRVAGDHLGMIATMLNAVAMQEIFINFQIPTKIMSALPIDGLIERYDYRRAIEYLAQGFVIIFAAGTGNPLVTTDTALCLRGIELKADLILKATNVDGVYTKDPKKERSARFYHQVSYDEAIAKKITVMDLAAFVLGKEHQMKLRVFNLHKRGALLRIVQGLNEGTLVA